MLKLTKTLLSAGVVLASASAAIAGDPPQALGLVAAAEPIPIHCKGAECSVNLSAFCLQQKRRSPAPTDLYRQAATGAVQVSTRTLDGAQVILDEKNSLSGRIQNTLRFASQSRVLRSAPSISEHCG